jgi:hypothetical protein
MLNIAKHKSWNAREWRVLSKSLRYSSLSTLFFNASPFFFVYLFFIRIWISFTSCLFFTSYRNSIPIFISISPIQPHLHQYRRRTTWSSRGLKWVWWGLRVCVFEVKGFVDSKGKIGREEQMNLRRSVNGFQVLLGRQV